MGIIHYFHYEYYTVGHQKDIKNEIIGYPVGTESDGHSDPMKLLDDKGILLSQ